MKDDKLATLEKTATSLLGDEKAGMVACDRPTGAGKVAWAGAASGASQVLAEHPLDVVKVRLQSRLAPFVGVQGPSQMLAATVQHEGALALFQGVTPRLFTYSFVKLSLFSLYEAIKPHTGGNAVAAGALAGGCNTLVACPQDLLKSQLQVLRVGSAPRWRAILEHTGWLLRVHGWRVLYRGWPSLVLRDTIGYGCLFHVFEAGKQQKTVPPWLASGLAGVAFYLTTMPIDRVKTVVMTQGQPAQSSWQVSVEILERDGVRGFYRGCTVTLLRTFVGQAVALTVYSMIEENRD